MNMRSNRKEEKYLRISVAITSDDALHIQEIIKEEYPEIKNFSEVVRIALRGYYKSWKMNKAISGIASLQESSK